MTRGLIGMRLLSNLQEMMRQVGPTSMKVARSSEEALLALLSHQPDMFSDSSLPGVSIFDPAAYSEFLTSFLASAASSTGPSSRLSDIDQDAHASGGSRCTRGRA